MRHIDRYKVNAYIMAMYIYQFGFLQPLASLVNSQIPIAGFSLLLLFVMLVNNKFKIKRYVFITFIVISVYFLLNALVLINNTIILLTYGEFLFKGFSAFIIASMTVYGRELYNAFLKLSVINFIAIALFPFVGFLDSMNYMRFGYAMIPSVIMFFYASYDSKLKNPLWIILTIVSLSLTIIYGSRGPLLILIIFASILLLFSKKIKFLKKLILISFSSILMYIVIILQLPIKALDYININMGLKSYTLNKFRMMITQGIEVSSSGRDYIYLNMIELIKSSPVIGNGIAIVQSNVGFTSHNIFLQILVESGLIGLSVWILVWAFCIKKYTVMVKLNDVGFYRVTILLVAVSMGRLLISSDLWLRPEYWFMLSLLLNFKPKINLLRIKEC